MNVYLCGQRSFWAAVLRQLIDDGHSVCGVSAPPGDRLSAAAEMAGVRLMPSGMLSADNLPSGVDLIVAAHSHDFIGRRTRMKTKLGAVGYHPSLLPRHRGRDAVRWTVAMRDPVAGGSVYWLSDSVDGGDIAAQDWFLVPPKADASSLWRDHLFPIGLRLFRRVLSDLDSGTIVAIPQDEAVATWEPSWERQPLRRPDLFMLGDGSKPGFTVRREVA